MGGEFAAVIRTVEIHAESQHVWLCGGRGGVRGERGEDVVAVVDASVEGAEVEAPAGPGGACVEGCCARGPGGDVGFYEERGET